MRLQLILPWHSFPFLHPLSLYSKPLPPNYNITNLTVNLATNFVPDVKISPNCGYRRPTKITNQWRQWHNTTGCGEKLWRSERHWIGTGLGAHTYVRLKACGPNQVCNVILCNNILFCWMWLFWISFFFSLRKKVVAATLNVCWIQVPGVN